MRFLYTNQQKAGEWTTEQHALRAASRGDTLLRHLIMQDGSVRSVYQCKVWACTRKLTGNKRVSEWEKIK